MKHRLAFLLLTIFHFSLFTFHSLAQTPVYLDPSKDIETRVEDALSRMTLAEKIAVIHAQSKFSSAGVKRLGFPDFWTDDGPHGVRPDVLWDEWEQAGQSNDSCVAFPALTCLSATWNIKLSYMYGHALGEEALYRGKSMILGPGVNIYRTPLGGRNFEYMGEDPYLTSQMVVPYVLGLQSVGVASCVKHYCLNNDEEYRHQVNVIVSDRALHEIYLPGFEAAVKEGKAWGVMGAYNLYKDEHNCHNQYTLNKILKQDWGFDGVVVSDWGGAHDLDQAVRNGLDMEFGTWTDGLTMGATNAYDMYFLSKQYQKAILEGKYTTKELDEKVRRVLRLFFRTTMNKQKPYGFLCSESHYDVARKVAGEGIVLLKNDRNVLPIKAEGKKILVVGENAIKMMTVGGGSSSLKAQHEISPLEGLQRILSNSPLKGEKQGSTQVNSLPLREGRGGSLSLDFARGYVGDVGGSYNGVTTGQNLKDDRSPEDLIAEAVDKAKTADYVIIFGGLNKSNYQDCEGHDRKTMELPYNQDKLITAIAAVNKQTIYVNISGNAVCMPWREQVPAIVQGWFLGSEAGIALADVLLGNTNPSGHLPFTWYENLDQCGAHSFGEAAFPGIWREGKKVIDEEYKEGIYVGYRWTDKQKLKPAFAFGHGLSYTTFKISNLKQVHASNNGKMQFSVDIKNTGDREGSDVVQLYITDVKSSVDRPVKELKAFQKVTLKPGETRTVFFVTDRRALSFWDETTGGWKAEPGDFIAHVGDASDRLACKIKFSLSE